jgi:hypothetical protein
METNGEEWRMRAKKVDENQAEIVAEFRRLGWTVQDLHTHGGGVCDIMITKYTANESILDCPVHLIEIKSKSGRYTKSELDFILHFPVITVRSIEDVKELFG